MNDVTRLESEPPECYCDEGALGCAVDCKLRVWTEARERFRRSSTYGRRTDDGTYPNVEEERLKMEERAAAATVSETSTTWEHGFVKCMMHTSTKGGTTTRTVKVIDMRPRPKQHGMQSNTQWEGTFEEFLQYTGSLDKLFPLVTAKRHEGET